MQSSLRRDPWGHYGIFFINVVPKVFIVVFRKSNYIAVMRNRSAAKKEAIMNTIDTNEIIWQAKKMRAEEIRRIEGLAAKRLGLYFRLLAGSAADAGNSLQPLFSWNPQDAKAPRRSGPRCLRAPAWHCAASSVGTPRHITPDRSATVSSSA
jgi:hypothetical protein